MTAALNAANERANELFRGEKLGYLGIPKAVEMVSEVRVMIIITMFTVITKMRFMTI